MTTMTTDQRWIERAEDTRDLKRQLVGLAAEDEQEISFQEWSPGRKIVTIWSMEDGEEANLPRYQAVAAVNSGRWTAYKDRAPVQRVNTYKCFLHPESPERAVLDEIGITRRCPAAHLANNGSRRVHAENRHKNEWRQYQEHLEEIRDKEDRAERREELAAFKAIALANRGGESDGGSAASGLKIRQVSLSQDEKKGNE